MANKYENTGQWKEAFLLSFRRFPTIASAARAARIVRGTVYQALKDDPEFKAAFDAANEEATESLEREAIRRARDGVKRRKGIYYQGDLVATEVETEYSDTLLIFLLKSRRPDVYREPVQRIAQVDSQGNDLSPTNEHARIDRVMVLLDGARERRDRDAVGAGEGDLDALPGPAD